MFAKFLPSAVICAVVLSLLSAELRAQSPTITVDWVNVDNSAGHVDPDFPAEVVTVDIVVNVTGGCPQENDWTAASFETLLNGATVYQHPLGAGLNPPPAAAFGAFPGLEFDTYVCSADPDLSDSAPSADMILGLTESTHEFAVTWLDETDTGNGSFAIARISLLPCRDNAAWWPLVGVNSSCTGGQTFYQAMFLSPKPCPGDLNNDIAVDLSDLALLLSSYEVNNGGDQDCDGDTDLEDLADLLANYGCE